ncbi:MAG: hypothetical protein JSV80_14530 [Acidobacteriota bacterium]|nr:MAG: hypothetical protein JSV80_14530 [Acidobacteriota bacterium]
MPPLTVLVVVLVLLGSAGCDHDDAEPIIPALLTTLELRNDAGEVRTSFAAGESITLVLNVTNLTSNRRVFDFPTTQVYDFVVSEPGGLDVWVWSHGMAFPATATRLDFEPGETKQFTEVWTQIDNDGEPVPVGSYEATGYLVIDVAGSRSNVVLFSIE